QTLAGGRSEAETTGLLGKRVGTLAGVPEIKLSADSATPPGSNPSPDAFRGLRPSALPPPNIWQPFRLLGIEDFALALNTYRLGRSLFQAVGLPGGDRLLLWQQRRVRLPQKGKQIRQALHGQALFQALRHECFSFGIQFLDLTAADHGVLRVGLTQRHAYRRFRGDQTRQGFDLRCY